jgi:DNA-binding phage protein
MPRKIIAMPVSSTILADLRKAVVQQGTNPYQIAKSSGMPLTTVQRLLQVDRHVPLRNVELLLETLGLQVSLVPKKRSPSARRRGSAKR